MANSSKSIKTKNESEIEDEELEYIWREYREILFFK